MQHQVPFISGDSKLDNSVFNNQYIYEMRADYFLDHIKVNFIKIDTEGYDLNVINGMKKIILKNKPVVLLELNHWCLNAFQRMSVPDFLEKILKIFPFVIAIDDAGEETENLILDLTNREQYYKFLRENIIHNNYFNLVGFFSKNQIKKLYEMKKG
jgi:hypothetical protein